MKRYGIETLHEHRASLEQKARFSGFPCTLWNFPTEIKQKLASWCVKNAQGLNGDRLKDVLGIKISALFLAGSSKLCRRTWLGRLHSCTTQPMDKLLWRPNSTLPLDQGRLYCKTIRPLAIWSEQTRGLFGDRQTCKREGRSLRAWCQDGNIMACPIP